MRLVEGYTCLNKQRLILQFLIANIEQWEGDMYVFSYKAGKNCS